MFNFTEYIKELEITNHKLKQALDVATKCLREIISGVETFESSDSLAITAGLAISKIKQITEKE